MDLELNEHEATLRREYTELDHEVWGRLFARQMACVDGLTCSAFNAGFARLGYDPQRLPDPVAISRRIRDLTGWQLTSAENEYLGATEWFIHIQANRFPVTNYIREPESLEFTPLPDLFHEFFGHLAFFTDPRFAEILAAVWRAIYAGRRAPAPRNCQAVVV